ncbi:hypothetical protein [Halotia branconii]|uniref:Uncharacterized protein n=1 Tax=Halotia branconii CENA392 TaxID=1539056 RepID=A0AAJ6NWY3_9CYAN|nr:hypothetical protein [Halotia branconii]WGV28147.1 hypothetical protein QI031_12020 [Halotia branconii CENA392]
MNPFLRCLNIVTWLEKTAKNAIKLLLATGMIQIQERTGTTNIYTLTPATQ